MVLNRDEIVKRGLIEGIVEKSLRDCSYDVTIAELFGAGEKSSDEIVLDSQGIVLAISHEILRLPPDVCAHATVKTSLCREGVLAINIGVVDPGWQAPISSILLNFGKSTYRLHKGEAFLRLTFHTLNAPEKASAPTVIDRASYTQAARRTFDSRMAHSFMDFKKAAEKASQEYIQDMRNALLKYVPAAGFLLAVLTILANWGVSAITKRSIPQDFVQAQAQVLTSEIKQDNQKLHDENSRLEKELKDLRDRLDDLAKPKKKP